jgi:hypothetical protein
VQELRGKRVSLRNA